MTSLIKHFCRRLQEEKARLILIKARHAEAGGGDGDKEWLIARLEAAISEADPLNFREHVEPDKPWPRL